MDISKHVIHTLSILILVSLKEAAARPPCRFCHLVDEETKKKVYLGAFGGVFGTMGFICAILALRRLCAYYRLRRLQNTHTILGYEDNKGEMQYVVVVHADATMSQPPPPYPEEPQTTQHTSVNNDKAT